MAIKEGYDETFDFTRVTQVPSLLVKKWMKAFFAPQEAIKFPQTPRLLNRFALGADPEFAFMQIQGGGYYHAQGLGMNTILPFGCDMAGRQAELRAHSSRFALEVVASLMDALRWIPRFYETNRYNWMASPFVGNDGCGGHIHFGRKRPTRGEEVVILDYLMALLSRSEVFDQRGTQVRAEQTKYGQNGDIRLQSHGYEYRAFPTWLSSPWQAYFTMVASKLALYYGLPIMPKYRKEHIQLLNLFRFYRHTDDDAAIALRAFSLYGMPKHDNTCFKARWGVQDQSEVEKIQGILSQRYFPLSLVPEKDTVQELFSSFVAKVPIPRRKPVPTWTPFALRQGFRVVTVQPHILELPNIAQGLVSKYFQVEINRAEREPFVHIYGPTKLLDISNIRKAINALGADVCFDELQRQQNQIVIQVPAFILRTRERVQMFREIISDTLLFPICKGENLEHADWIRWDNPRTDKDEKLIGRFLGNFQGQKVAEKPKAIYGQEAF